MEIRRQTFRIILYLIAAFVGLIFVLPLLWMVSTSFKPPQEVMSIPSTFFPKEPTIGNYVRLFREGGMFLRYMLNSTFVGTVNTGVSLFLSSLAGFVLAKYSFRGREIAFWLIVSCLMIPFQITFVPLFELVAKLKWTNSYWGLIIPRIISPFGVFMMRQFVRTIPNDLMDSSRLDGAHEIGIFFRIIIPLVKAPLAVLTVFYFMWDWDSFLWPLIIVQTDNLKTLPLGLAAFGNQYYMQYHYVMAGAVITVLPVIVVFFIFQKQIIKGITLTGLKL